MAMWASELYMEQKKEEAWSEKRLFFYIPWISVHVFHFKEELQYGKKVKWKEGNVML